MDAQEIKQLKELQDAYLSVYEAKKVDQDEDGDNDFADIRIARLVASGVSKEEAIRRVRDKEYNEAYVPWDFGPKDKAKAKYDELAARKKAGGSAPGTATRANRIASVAGEMRTTLDLDSAMTMTNPKKQGLQPSTPRHTAAAIRGAGGGMTARTKFRKEEFELWVNDLIGEGYDLSDYTWDEMYESYLDEGLRSAVSSAVKRLLGGGKKETEAPKPQSIGDQLRKKYNLGPEGSDTSPKMEILKRAKRNAEEAQNQVNMGNAPQSYADRAKAAHDRYLKAGYSKYGADLPVSGGQGGSGGRGGGNKARKRAAALNAAALNREEFEIIVDALIEEGYDLSSYTWNEMYEICLDEAVEGLNEIDSSTIARTANKRMQNLSAAEKKEMGARNAGAPMGELSGLSAETSDAAAKVRRHRALSTAHARSRKRMKDAGQNVQDSYEYDIFDSILEHLIAEGYADTNESALVIMANMSEEWRQSIVDSSI